MTDPAPPTPVTVTAPMRRNYSPAMFADLVRPDVTWTKTITTGLASDGTKVWDVTFRGTEPGPALDDETAAAIRERMASRDDVDMAARDALRVARDAVVAGPTLANVAALSVLHTNYTLGEMP